MVTAVVWAFPESVLDIISHLVRVSAAARANVPFGEEVFQLVKLLCTLCPEVRARVRDLLQKQAVYPGLFLHLLVGEEVHAATICGIAHDEVGCAWLMRCFTGGASSPTISAPMDDLAAAAALTALRHSLTARAAEGPGDLRQATLLVRAACVVYGAASAAPMSGEEAEAWIHLITAPARSCDVGSPSYLPLARSRFLIASLCMVLCCPSLSTLPEPMVAWLRSLAGHRISR